MQTITLKVEGMSCNHCVSSIEGALKELGASGNVSLPNKSVTVAFDEKKLNEAAIREAIEDQGYDVVK
ncbi:copper ion binding protein [Paenibacillus sp. NPDC056579]|uniref:copper ion binding protein n=1 Tax=unclassified Paenibacillus TaxID=185978 RepID=UPI001EF7A1E7|nr:copper ion binding protein [Paenibacillus sp. H1-7]ULL14103.1 copper chaperone [Paenibacillus sp. H1-7]